MNILKYNEEELTFLEIKTKILKESLIAGWLDLTSNIYLVMGKNLPVELILPFPYIPQIFPGMSGIKFANCNTDYNI